MSNNLLNQILQRLQGNSDTAKAMKIANKCQSIVKSQISGLEGRIVDLSDELEEAKEVLEDSIFVTERPTNNEAYIKNIDIAQQTVNGLEHDLEEAKGELTYFKTLKERFDEENSTTVNNSNSQ